MTFFRVEPGDAAIKGQLAAHMGTTPGGIQIAADPDHQDQLPGYFHCNGQGYEFDYDRDGQLLPASIPTTGHPLTIVRVPHR